MRGIDKVSETVKSPRSRFGIWWLVGLTIGIGFLFVVAYGFD